MKTHTGFRPFMHGFWIVAGLILAAVSTQADPIPLQEKSITPEVSLLITCAILLEVICIWLMLRRWRRPYFFVLWLIAMHAVTYPAFMGLLWLLQDLRSALAVAIGEGLVVVAEGSLIWLICRFAISPKPLLPAPSLGKCWLASLAGNLCSAAAFPILVAISNQ